MAQFWFVGAGGEWMPQGLERDACHIDAHGVRWWAGDGVPPAESAALVCRRSGEGPDATWSLLIPPEVPAVVNGTPMPLGLVVLADRDEIRLPGVPPLYFSTETLPVVEACPVARPGLCPRCKLPIEAGCPAVRCPDCGLWHHQSDALPCWTYAETCAVCARPTALDAGFSWSPDVL